ncbi:hypothetical protein ACFU96_10295 [Streptomyces sp. NPDC057620]|uniref:hypothetical protein n=1 Tax=Streptomyces sp. NPDC057620 TaxID=3346185 RepID=UPI00369DFF9E
MAALQLALDGSDRLPSRGSRQALVVPRLRGVLSGRDPDLVIVRDLLELLLQCAQRRALSESDARLAGHVNELALAVGGFRVLQHRRGLRVDVRVDRPAGRDQCIGQGLPGRFDAAEDRPASGMGRLAEFLGGRGAAQ